MKHTINQKIEFNEGTGRKMRGQMVGATFECTCADPKYKLIGLHVNREITLDQWLTEYELSTFFDEEGELRYKIYTCNCKREWKYRFTKNHLEVMTEIDSFQHSKQVG